MPPGSARRRTLASLLLAPLAAGTAALPWVLAAGRGDHAPPRAPLRVTFLDVGQGDAAVIEGPTGRVAVIDGGGRPGTDEAFGDDPGSRVVVPFLRSRGISAVDLLVPTHPDDDHAQGLNAVTTRLGVRAALVCGYPGPSAPYTRLLARLRARRVPLYVARRGQRIDLGGGARLEVLAPTDRPILSGRSVTNDNCTVLRLVYGRARFLFTGDAEAEEEADILHSGADISADVLKVGHHGSRWSTSPPFLAAVRPAIAVISVGASNTFGHPHREVLERLAGAGARVYRTDRQGAITIETDGERIHVRTAR